MDWLAASLGKVWEAYREGLIYACPDHRSAECARAAEARIAENITATRMTTQIVHGRSGEVRTVIASQTVSRSGR